MNAISRLIIITIVCGTWSLPVFALHSGLADAKGECAFSKEFIRDYESAQKMVDELQSAEPLLKLATMYKKTAEQAELELSIGLAYNQRTGVVDPAKAVLHLSNALKFDLPERTRLKIFMWRGNSLEGLKKHDAALQDYLRGLLACSYYDLSGEWPEIKPSNVPIYMNSDDPKNAQRVRDHQRYRKTIDFQRFLFMQRYYLIDAIKRLQTNASIDEDQVRKVLKELSPDTSRYSVVVGFIESENKRPWP
jgi:hypothetical protein